jgi:hypothetical protein
MMKSVVQIEHRVSSSRGKHEGESSFGLCDRLSRTRDNSQRQLPTDQDYAVPTREYQTDQSSLKTAPTAARSVLEPRRNQRQRQTHRMRRLTRSLHIRPVYSSTPVCDRKFGQMWISAERRAFLEEIVSGQRDPWKQLCPLVLQAAPKYPVYSVQQLPRNSNERLETGFISS